MPREAAPKPMIDVMGVINNYRDSIDTAKLRVSKEELLVPLNTYKQQINEIRSIFAQCRVNSSTWDKQIEQLLLQEAGPQKYEGLKAALATIMMPKAAVDAATTFDRAMHLIAEKTAKPNTVRDLTLGDSYLAPRNELLSTIQQSSQGSIQGLRNFLEQGTNDIASSALQRTLQDAFKINAEQAKALLKDMLPALENANRKAQNDLAHRTREEAMPFFQKMTREMVRLSMLAEIAQIEANQNNKVFSKLPEDEQGVGIATKPNSARFKKTNLAELEQFQTRDSRFLSFFWAPHVIQFDKETGMLKMSIPAADFLENPDDRLHDAQTFVKTLFAHAKNPHESGLSFTVNMVDIAKNQHPQEKPGRKSAENMVRVMVKQALELGMPLEKLHFKVNDEEIKPQELRAIVGEEVISRSQQGYKKQIEQYKVMTGQHEIRNEPVRPDSEQGAAANR